MSIMPEITKTPAYVAANGATTDSPVGSVLLGRVNPTAAPQPSTAGLQFGTSGYRQQEPGQTDSVIMHKCGAGCACSGTPTHTTGRTARTQWLKEQDAKTRKHELAHKATAQQWATSMPVYNLDADVDGTQYANGGHVDVDTSPLKDPKQTVQKMKTLMAASIAPDEPSSADYGVYALCAAQLAQAQSKLDMQPTGQA